MANAWVDANQQRRNLARRVYARDKADPGYVCPGSVGRPCGRPIDWDLPYKDPDTQQVNLWSKSVDHEIELQDGGELLDLDNAVSVHLTCNSSKGAARRHQREKEERQQIGAIHIDPATI